MRTRMLAAVTPLFLAVACGGSPTAEEAEGPPTDGDTEDGAGQGEVALESSFGDVFAAVEGLEGQERRDTLIALAEGEDDLNLYTSLNEPVANGLLDAYEEDTGLTVSLYRASSETVRSRLLEEAAAGFTGADVVETNGPEMVTLGDEGVFEPLSSPAQDGLTEGSARDTWTATRFNIFTVAWNTDLVDQPPTSYEELADDQWNGQMAMEVGDFEWYWAVWNYLVDDAGMSEEEADEFFQQMADGAVFTSGHTTMRQLLIAGEYPLVTSDYSYGIAEAKDGGAPVEWQPPVEPLFARPNGIGLVRNAPNPAAALLFTEWILTDGQEVLRDSNIDPVRTDLQEFGDADVRVIELEDYLPQESEFSSRYEELARVGEQVEG